MGGSDKEIGLCSDQFIIVFANRLIEIYEKPSSSNDRIEEIDLAFIFGAQTILDVDNILQNDADRGYQDLLALGVQILRTVAAYRKLDAYKGLPTPEALAKDQIRRGARHAHLLGAYIYSSIVLSTYASSHGPPKRPHPKEDPAARCNHPGSDSKLCQMDYTAGHLYAGKVETRNRQETSHQLRNFDMDGGSSQRMLKLSYPDKPLPKNAQLRSNNDDTDEELLESLKGEEPKDPDGAETPAWGKPNRERTR